MLTGDRCMSRHHFLFGAVAVLLVLAPPLDAQTTTGTVRGYVKDQTGAAIADAEVQARNPATGLQRVTTSRTDGSYILPGLAPATYELSVRHIGSTPQQRQVVVQIGATQVVDFNLQAGAVELQAVIVTAAPAVGLPTSEVSRNNTPQPNPGPPTPHPH